MPPPDTYALSVVTGRSRVKPLQSSSQIDPSEGCSHWADMPPRKKLAVKAMMGEIEPVFQKAEKEKKTAASGNKNQEYDPNN